MSKLLRLIRCLALAGLAACSRIEPPESDGKLVVAIRETPAFFQRDGSTPGGFEHELVTAFADSLGLKVGFINAADPYELNDLALAGRVHIAASMPLGNSHLPVSTPIRSVSQWIVGHNDILGPEQLSDLAGQTVEVMAGSPLADTLRGLDEKSRPRVIEVPGVNEMELLARVAERRVALAAVHEINLDLGINFYPELSPLLQLPGKLEFGWVFAGDANGDGVSGSNDLFYAPSGPSDPKVRWLSTTERDAYFSFAESNGLSKYAGSVVPRNSAHSPWMQTVDFTITQQIPMFKRLHAEAYIQMINLFNLLNKDWGIVEEVPFTYKRRVAGAGYDPTGNGGQGQYVYVFNGNTLDGLPIIADDTQASRWQGKVGIRVKF